MDAEGTVHETVSELREYMNRYAAAKGEWIAPYTSLVTSSMMGKSRHMKEVANYLPSVYICLRGEVRGNGYPRPSPSIVDWSSMGASTILGKPVREYHFCLSTFRWSAFIVSTIHSLARWIDDGRFFTSLGIDDWTAKKLEFAWLWKFFAEPPDSCKLQDFWLEVQEATDSKLRGSPDGISAHSYFQKTHTREVQDAVKQLRQCFAKHQINDNSLPLILVYDEARTLCDHDAYNGVRIYEELTINFNKPKHPPKYVRNDSMPLRSFSNFHALQCALRYLSMGTSEVPRIFAVFTDTASRITNFQPISWNDSSLRVQSLPAPGRHQFPPIFVFSSVDVYSRVLNYSMCISSPEYVAEPERLLKFGRAGWYSVYFHGNVSRKANLLPQSDLILSIATSKLLGTSDLHRSQEFFNATGSLTPANLIKMIAVLAPRLALTIGPYTLEASELIASHLAVLTRTDDRAPLLASCIPKRAHLSGSVSATHS